MNQSALTTSSHGDGASKLNEAGDEPGALRASAPGVSVILPVFNEEKIINWVFDCVANFAERHLDYEFIFVDDGSSDNTPAILENRIKSLGKFSIHLIKMEENSGKGAAMKRGFGASRGDAVLFTDGDLAYSLDYLPVIQKALAGCDLVIASRRLGGDSGGRKGAIRYVMGEGFNRAVRLIMRLPYKDTQAGLKGFSRRAAQQLFVRTRIDRYSTDVELLYLARKFKLSVEQIPAQVDQKHVSTQSSINLWKDPPCMFMDMLRIRWNSLQGRYK